MRSRGRPLLSFLVSAQIHILSPSSLISEFQKLPSQPGVAPGTIIGSTATFGTPFYDQRVKGRIRYARPTRDHHHCTEQGYEIPDLPQYDNREVVRIVMVDRGECTFVTKVRIAQDYKGAAAVIVVDNQNLSPGEIQHLIMADDGWGGQMTKIPSILISGAEGDKIKNSVLAGEEVLVELAWDIPMQNVANLDFWHSSGSREANEFLVEIADYVLLLRWKMQYRPHFHVFSLPKDAKEFNQLCLPADGSGRFPEGKFCATDPDGDGPITGVDVLMEDVHQYCIWETGRKQPPQDFVNGLPYGTKVTATYSPTYWNYLVMFHESCPINGANPETRYGSVCARMVRAKIPEIIEKDVENCILGKASILEQQTKDQAWSPLAARINGWRYAGPLEAVTVVKALCSGFMTRPQECEDLRYNQYKVVRHITGVGFFSAVSSLCSLVASIVLLFYIYQRYLQKSVRAALREEVMLEVRSQMTDYQQMPDQGSSRGRMF
jgi:hypothetical protein